MQVFEGIVDLLNFLLKGDLCNSAVRQLPLPGQTHVEKGTEVDGDQLVARTELPGNVSTLNVGGLLGVPPEDVPGLMLKQAGDAVGKDEVVARSKGLFGLFKSEVKAPWTGHISSKRVEVGDYAAPGQPLVEMVAMDRLKVRAAASAADVPYLEAGVPVVVRVEENGHGETMPAGLQAEGLPVGD